MKSTGNDIVALALTDKQRTIQPQFYSKFITAPELELCPQDLEFEHFVWLLWSVKESAYKYLKRSEADLVFSPSKIIINHIWLNPGNTPSRLKGAGIDDSFYTGKVQIQSQTLHFISTVNAQRIACVVNSDANFDRVYWGIKQIEESNNKAQSAAVRQFTLQAIKPAFPNKDLHITESNGTFPAVLADGLEMNACLSFAHHGNFVSYSFLVE